MTSKPLLLASPSSAAIGGMTEGKDGSGEPELIQSLFGELIGKVAVSSLPLSSATKDADSRAVNSETRAPLPSEPLAHLNSHVGRRHQPERGGIDEGHHAQK